MSIPRNLSSLSRLLVLLAVAIVFHTAPFAFAQRPNPAPTMLSGPADWRFERLPIPPGFAPDISWKGFEEARFAPGMFDPSSPNHFTYALAISIEGTSAIGAAELKDFLDKYFKGLCTAVGQRKGLKPDPKEFDAKVEESTTDPKRPGHFTAKAPCFDTFNDGRKLLLNMEIAVIPKTDEKKTLVVLLISPKPSDGEIWKQLRTIGQSVEGH